MTLKKTEHSFKHAALSYDARPNRQPYIRLSFFFHKLPGISYEQFHRHWETVHADLTVACKDFKDCHIGRYVQFHQTEELKEKAKELGLPQMMYDGCSDIYVKDWQEWMRFYSSPLYAASLARMRFLPTKSQRRLLLTCEQLIVPILWPHPLRLWWDTTT
jgi:hypothetical protein